MDRTPVMVLYDPITGTRRVFRFGGYNNDSRDIAVTKTRLEYVKNGWYVDIIYAQRSEMGDDEAMEGLLLKKYMYGRPYIRENP